MIFRSPLRTALALAAFALLFDFAGAAARPRQREAPPETPVIELLQVTPRALPGEAAPEVLTGLLTLPSGWQPGDAAAILIPERFPGDRIDDRLAEVLLAEGAALLELDIATARGGCADTAVPPVAEPPGAVLPDLFGALAALRRQVGAGPVIVLGRGAAGTAAMLAADPAQAERRLAPREQGFVAAIEIGPALGGFDWVGFAPGAAPSAAEAWPKRVPLLCEAIAWAVAGHAAEGAAAQRLTSRCLDGLQGGAVREMAAPTLRRIARSR